MKVDDTSSSLNVDAAEENDADPVDRQIPDVAPSIRSAQPTTDEVVSDDDDDVVAKHVDVRPTVTTSTEIIIRLPELSPAIIVQPSFRTITPSLPPSPLTTAEPESPDIPITPLGTRSRRRDHSMTPGWELVLWVLGKRDIFRANDGRYQHLI
jgi:hypothetical protein